MLYIYILMLAKKIIMGEIINWKYLPLIPQLIGAHTIIKIRQCTNLTKFITPLVPPEMPWTKNTVNDNKKLNSNLPSEPLAVYTFSH